MYTELLLIYLISCEYNNNNKLIDEFPIFPAEISI